MAARLFVSLLKVLTTMMTTKFDNVDSIEFKNVCFTYPGANDSTIKNMSFKVKKGENIAIVGENGAGKTTLIRIVCGLQKPTLGKYTIYGVSNENKKIIKSRKRLGAIIEK